MLRSQTSFNFHFQKKDHFKHLVCKFSFCYLKTTFKNFFFFLKTKLQETKFFMKSKHMYVMVQWEAKFQGSLQITFDNFLVFYSQCQIYKHVALSSPAYHMVLVEIGSSLFYSFFSKPKTQNKENSIFTNLYDNNRNKHKSSNSIIGQDGH